MSQSPMNPGEETQPAHGYWRSLAELSGQADVQLGTGDEFPPEEPGAEGAIDPLSRRNFFHLMGASMALAGVAGAGCKRYEKEEIVPLTRRPEEQVPGNTLQYASTFELGGAGHALVVTAYEGRPIKIDGNPDHPFAGGGSVPGTQRHGGSSAFAQASILSMYDPDRSQTVLNKGQGATFEALRTWIGAQRNALAAQGSKLRVLAEASSSPTLAAAKAALLAFAPGAQWHEWESLSWDNERVGTQQVFGRPVRPVAKLDKCETIVALDCDLFVEHPASMRYSRDFARSRRQEGGSLGDGKMNRLWAIESTFTSTGAVADHRLPVRSELVLPIVAALDAALAGGAAAASDVLRETKVAKFVEVLTKELRQGRGRSVLVAGRRQPPVVHALVAKINEALGAPGATLAYHEVADPDRVSHAESVARLVQDIRGGGVETLIILGGNPVYDAPADLEFGAALAGIATSIHVAEYANETSLVSTWHMPRAHYLESWNDARTWDGTITMGQPIIAPLYGGVTPAEFVHLLVGSELAGEKLVRATYEKSNAAFDWRKAIHDGFVDGSALPAAQVQVGGAPTVSLSATQRQGSRVKNGELEVVFAPSSMTFDGRFANNAWLQETPDFLTKITWDNYALVAPATATELGLAQDTLIKVTVGGKTVEVACYQMPGQAQGSIGLVLGGGRTAAGHVGGNGHKKVGFDVGRVRSTTGLDIATGASVAATGKAYALANVQEHWDMRTGLDKVLLGKNVGNEGSAERVPKLVRETTAKEAMAPGYKAETTTEYFQEKKRGLSLFQEQEYGKHQWGMAIDLGGCTGCNACTVACQAENNIPVVGKNQIFKNREMSWLRIDRYFAGSVDDPEIVHQPVGCQHCENAPCEQVCPVGATLHSDEGLNDMAYNRCVGTRYCLNNCPYRVRRFNFFDYNKEFNEARNKVRQLIFNPEVTVRYRGVMEKCSYCVQRIQNGKIVAKNAQRPLQDGEIVTACQAACPTEAIVFGDLADKNSRISKLHMDKRAYGLLDDLLYTKPRTQFLARIRNPHPDMVEAKPAHQGGH